MSSRGRRTLGLRISNTILGNVSAGQGVVLKPGDTSESLGVFVVFTCQILGTIH